jgi:hypothetical protein
MSAPPVQGDAAVHVADGGHPAVRDAWRTSGCRVAVNGGHCWFEGMVSWQGLVLAAAQTTSVC